MRVEPIGETVQVRADFRGGEITPLRVRRGTLDHVVRRVNVHWIDRERTGRVFYFSVTVDSGDTFQLRLTSSDMIWHLDSVTMDG